MLIYPVQWIVADEREKNMLLQIRPDQHRRRAPKESEHRELLQCDVDGIKTRQLLKNKNYPHRTMHLRIKKSGQKKSSSPTSSFGCFVFVRLSHDSREVWVVVRSSVWTANNGCRVYNQRIFFFSFASNFHSFFVHFLLVFFFHFCFLSRAWIFQLINLSKSLGEN